MAGRRWSAWCAGVFGLACAGLSIGSDGAAEITVLVGAAEGRSPGTPRAEIVNEPFAVEFDTQGRLWGVEFIRGNRVFRSDDPIDGAAGPVAFEFVAGVFLPTDGKQSFAVAAASAAAESRFNGMHDLAVGRDGTVYLADTFDHVIRAFDPRHGRVTVLAGTGTAGFSGDGGPADEAAFNQPYCGTLSPDGTRLLVADIGNQRLRAIDLTTGIVTTIAGDGRAGKPLDGAAATGTPLAGPRAACAAADGTVYLALREGNAVVAVRDGRLHAVVNRSGQAGYAGDGGAAGDALLAGPKYVCVDHRQRLLIVDTENHCIRRYDPVAGTIDLVAGVPRRAGSAIAAGWTATHLRRPHGCRIAPDGRLVVVDSDNDRILIGPLDD